MKTLLTCSPTEFLAQAVRLREPLCAWAEKTGFDEIRSRRPEGFDGMSEAGKAQALKEQSALNLGEMFDAAMRRDPEGTLKVLAISCFTDPDRIDARPMRDYLAAFFDMLADDTVRGFFLCYARSGRGNSSAR